ncbi:MAG: metallophosphoesterase, partial [Oscillospiraceae bacterium]|nr:metallophosphoesterase [Oscillospiraceae bacterium]
FYKEKIGEDKMPIMVLGGDVADTLTTVDLQMAQKVFSAAVDSSKTELFLTPGNHDLYYSSASYVKKYDPKSLYSSKNGFSNYNPYAAFLGDLVYQDTSRTSEALLKQGYYHTVVRGYHFLSMVCISGDPTDAALTWVKNEMKTIREEGNGNKPVFVVTHSSVTEKTEKVLKDYPELVFLTGHTHASVFGRACVKQRANSFTSVHCGDLKTVNFPELGMIEIDANDTIRYSTYYMTFTEEGEETPKKRSYTVVEPDGNDHIFRVNERKEVSSKPTETSKPAETSKPGEVSSKPTETSKPGEVSSKPIEVSSVSSETSSVNTEVSSKIESSSVEMSSVSETSSAATETSSKEDASSSEVTSNPVSEAASETSSPKGSPGSAWIVGLVIALVLIAAAACGVWFFRKK